MNRKSFRAGIPNQRRKNAMSLLTHYICLVNSSAEVLFAVGLIQINAKKHGNRWFVQCRAECRTRFKGDLWPKRCQSNYKKPFWVREFCYNKEWFCLSVILSAIRRWWIWRRILLQQAGGGENTDIFINWTSEQTAGKTFINARSILLLWKNLFFPTTLPLRLAKLYNVLLNKNRIKDKARKGVVGVYAESPKMMQLRKISLILKKLRKQT